MSCLAAGVKGEKLNDKMTDRIPKVNKLHNTNKENFYPMPMYMCFTLCPLLDFIEIDICHRYLVCINGQSTETSKLSLNPIRSGSCHLS